jgi:hypothetical protein
MYMKHSQKSNQTEGRGKAKLWYMHFDAIERDPALGHNRRTRRFRQASHPPAKVGSFHSSRTAMANL